MPKPISPASKLAATKQREPRNQKTDCPRRKRVCVCRCREHRHKLGLTIDDVAAALQMSKANISELERGSEVQLTTCFKLAAFYGHRIDELWQPLEEPAHA